MPAEFPVTSVTVSNEVEVKNDSGNPVPSSDAVAQAKLDALHADLAELLVLHADLGSVLAKLSADPATQTTLAAFAAASHTDQAAILAKLTSDPATQTTLAAVLAKITADPSTGAKQDTQAGKLDTLHTDLGLVATQTTAAAILAKLSADPATQTTLAAVLAKLGTTLLVDTSSAAPNTVTRGTATGTVALPSGAKLHSVLVVPAAGGQSTVTIPGQSADQTPIDFPYSEDFKGGVVGSGNIVLAGSVAYYRITWHV